MQKKLSFSFYLDGDKVSAEGVSEVHFGNPGLGGTEYAIALTAFGLAQRGHIVRLYCTKEISTPRGVELIVVENFQGAINSSAQGSELLIYRPSQLTEDFVISKNANLEGASLIPWLQLTPKSAHLRKFAEIEQVVAVACLSRDQVTRLRDNPVWKKCILIPNPIVPSELTPSALRKENAFRVVYLGALVPQKGFHILADMWPKVLEKFPSAKLDVIGSGNLYSRSSKLGELGLADENYENRIFAKLSATEKSVKFWGTIEDPRLRRNIISRATLGVVNPSGETETFCISGVEIQSYGVPVVTIRRNALSDTIKHGKTGILFRSKCSFVRSLIKVLKSKKLHIHLGLNAHKWATTEFHWMKIAEKWEMHVSKLPKTKIVGLRKLHLDFVTIRWVVAAANYWLVSNFRGWPTFEEVTSMLKQVFRRLIVRTK